MIKYCPIMSYRDNNMAGIHCLEENCGMWDKEREQCCILTQAIAAAGKPTVAAVPGQVLPFPVMTPQSTGDWALSNPYRVDDISMRTPQPIEGLEYTFESGM